jgi:hypothetical protein
MCDINLATFIPEKTVNMYSGDSTVAGDISFPLALKTLEHSELYTRRKTHTVVEKCGPLDMSCSMADTLCDYDTLDSASLGGSSDCLVLPPALPPKHCSPNSVISTQFR